MTVTTENNITKPAQPAQEDIDVTPRHDWRSEEVANLFNQPLNDLLYQAHRKHRKYFDPNAVQLSTLINIKTGGCPEDCGYCPQSVHFDSGKNASSLAGLDEVIAAAKEAKAQGATRFCMGAAWRAPRSRDLEQVVAMIEAVKRVGLETCATLGMLDDKQAQSLKSAGLDFYNHNIDSSEAYYEKVITTRRFQDRLATLEHVRAAGISVCSGGIVGMGEERYDRIEFLLTLANLPSHPQSVPINLLVRVSSTPLAEVEPLDPFELVRTVAVARILMPASYVRLSAGRLEMSDELQALCFFAGANSVFYGQKLLTTDNPAIAKDRALFQRLGLSVQGQHG